MQYTQPTNTWHKIRRRPLGLLDFPGDSDTFWLKWTEAQRNKWFTDFDAEYGSIITQMAEINVVPRELLAAIIANEMIDFRWNDRAGLGKSLGPAQITADTLVREGIWNEQIRRGCITREKPDLEDPRTNIHAAAQLVKKYLADLANADDTRLTDFLRFLEHPLTDADRYAGVAWSDDPNVRNRDAIINRDVTPGLIGRMALMWNNGPKSMYLQDIFKQSPDGYANAVNATKIGDRFSPKKTLSTQPTTRP